MLTNKDMETLTRQRALFNDALAMFVGFHATDDIRSAEKHRMSAIKNGAEILATLENLNLEIK